MKDLIFRPPGTSAEKNENLRAKASLVYVEPKKKGGEDEEGEEEETEEEEGMGEGVMIETGPKTKRALPTGKTTIFSRVITSKGIGEYQINNKSVSFKTYEQKLASFGVLLKARNFLVFQGDVESLARKNPKQLVEMFENLSGSAELKDEYERAFKAKEEAEQRTIFAFNKTKEHKVCVAYALILKLRPFIILTITLTFLSIAIVNTPVVCLWLFSVRTTFAERAESEYTNS